ncbi:hypothetical protein [Calycomorphotria hydatis]|uniref:hypothetical protein n=1 Tax=Calycomorphotria hydatis TaxID=2528027 RepID=UPI0018D23B27|nr:hypothetical protein [Calycomorphotria hydatis]
MIDKHYQQLENLHTDEHDKVYMLAKSVIVNLTVDIPKIDSKSDLRTNPSLLAWRRIGYFGIDHESLEEYLKDHPLD